MPTESWGRVIGRERDTKFLHWRSDAQSITQWQGPVLPFGLGRSYGDSCLIKDGLLLNTQGMNKLRHFDPETGRLSCEAGLSIVDLLKFSIPRGWFIPVTPGTKFVTMGGAIANDVHGKNHHRRGTIGNHILELELMRSNGERLHCSLREEEALFRATIGGLGLTGLILSCTIQLMPISSAWIDAEMIKTANLDEFFEIDRTSDVDYEYTVSWIDCMAQGKDRGRGIFIRGNHAKGNNPKHDYAKQKGLKLTVPFNAPDFTLNKFSIKAFNEAYYHKQFSKLKMAKQGIDPFFYPLDAVGNWNKVYGKKGLLQYQCTVPREKTDELNQIFDKIAKSGQGSFLGVLKRFGDIKSPGLMSYPSEGYTLALDFRNQGKKSLELFQELDRIVLRAGGKLYPAKDLLMGPEAFQRSYPQWTEFARFIDPLFESMFWQRVTARDK